MPTSSNKTTQRSMAGLRNIQHCEQEAGAVSRGSRGGLHPTGRARRPHHSHSSQLSGHSLTTTTPSPARGAAAGGQPLPLPWITGPTPARRPSVCPATAVARRGPPSPQSDIASTESSHAHLLMLATRAYRVVNKVASFSARSPRPGPINAAHGPWTLGHSLATCTGATPAWQ
jgi:hypothetical protein